MTQVQVNNSGNIKLDKRNDIVLTQYMKNMTSRALAYLNAGFPIHLKGCAGVGKTIIALHMAHVIKNPTTIIFGNEDFQTSDMVGLQYGYRKKLIIDEFVHSVYKKVEDYEQKWMDGRIVEACEKGHTLIYDEFNRSKPETNNILLSVLEERVLELPTSYRGEKKMIKVHPEFKAIFTSNPEEYAGVYKSQNALVDRLITIELDFPDKESEIGIAETKSGMNKEDVKKIVTIVRNLREKYKSKFDISIRHSIKLCKVIESNKIDIDEKNQIFRQICMDILTSGLSAQKANINKEEIINSINQNICLVTGS